MPIRIGRLPIPSLRTYTCFSFVLMGLCVWYAHEGVMIFNSDGVTETDQSTNRNVDISISSSKSLTEGVSKYDTNDMDLKSAEVTKVDEVASSSQFERTENAIKVVMEQLRKHKVNIVQKPNETYDERYASVAAEKPAKEDEARTEGTIWRIKSNVMEEDSGGRVYNEDEFESYFMDYTLNESDSYWMKMFKVIMQETWCVLVLVNFAYCCLFLFSKCLQLVVIGKLRVSERQHLKEKFGNFVFYKFIFIFGVLNAQLLEEMVLWSAWFSALAFLHLFVLLCKDRSEYLSSSPTTSNWMHGKVMGLLVCILSAGFILVSVCFLVGYSMDINIFLFMLAECIIVIVRTIFVIVKYSIHLYDLHFDGLWEERGSFIYYTDLVLDTTVLTVDFFHHLHMLLWGNIFLSMASLVICMQLRYLYTEIQHKLKKHKKYRRVVKSLETRFAYATREELDSGDDTCAICWDQMTMARKLPCNHFFHNSCLRSWMEHDTSCPTCRKSLSLTPERPAQAANENAQNQARRAAGIQANMRAARAARAEPHVVNQRNVFHFDGSRFFNWLPSFSVEVMHTGNLMHQHAAQANSQLDTWAHNIQQMFPNVALNVILEDLRHTSSMEVTIDNILEGRIFISPQEPPANNAAPPPEAPNMAEFQRIPVQINANTNPHANLSPSYNIETQPSATSEMEQQTDVTEDNVTEQLNRSDEVNTSDSPSIGSLQNSFSKSGPEREGILTQRKQQLLQRARRQYMMKHIDGHPPQVSSSSLDNTIDEEASTVRRRVVRNDANEQETGRSRSSAESTRHDQSDMRHRRLLAFEAALRRMNNAE